MKIVGVVLVSLLPILIGLEVRGTMKKRLDILTDYYKFIIFTREQIRYFGREISEIAVVMKNKREFQGEHFLPICEFGRKKALPDNIATVLLRAGVKKEDADILIAFLEGLGLNDTEGQLSHCGYYEREMLSQINILGKDFRLKSKVYLSLSIAAALTFFILTI